MLPVPASVPVLPVPGPGPVLFSVGLVLPEPPPGPVVIPGPKAVVTRFFSFLLRDAPVPSTLLTDAPGAVKLTPDELPVLLLLVPPPGAVKLTPPDEFPLPEETPGPPKLAPPEEFPPPDAPPGPLKLAPPDEVPPPEEVPGPYWPVPPGKELPPGPEFVPFPPPLSQVMAPLTPALPLKNVFCTMALRPSAVWAEAL